MVLPIYRLANYCLYNMGSLKFSTMSADKRQLIQSLSNARSHSPHRWLTLILVYLAPHSPSAYKDGKCTFSLLNINIPKRTWCRVAPVNVS